MQSFTSGALSMRARRARGADPAPAIRGAIYADQARQLASAVPLPRQDMSSLRNTAIAFVTVHAIYLGAAFPADAAPVAELVSMRTDDRVLLHGLHYRPQQQSQSVVIQVPGGPGVLQVKMLMTGEGS